MQSKPGEYKGHAVPAPSILGRHATSTLIVARGSRSGMLSRDCGLYPCLNDEYLNPYSTSRRRYKKRCIPKLLLPICSQRCSSEVTQRIYRLRTPILNLPPMDPLYPLFSVMSFLGFFLALVPLSWHFQAWNAGTCLYMIWAALACLNQFVNSIIWHGNALNLAPIWCDISSRIIIGAAAGLPASSLCINRRLYVIASVKTVNVTKQQKRRAVVEDICIGLVLPLIAIALEYIVAGHRFNIIEDIGCYPVVINVWLAYLLVNSWPVLFGLISAIYCVLSLRAFHRQNETFNELLSSSKSLTVNRYFRLMALATTELLCTTPFASYSIYLNLTTGRVGTYRGWADLHYGWSRVDQIPAVIWRSNREVVIAFELTRWMVVVCALLFFLFFGFAEEAQNQYRAAFNALASRLPGCGRKSKAPVKENRSDDELPSFVKRRKRDSFGSIISMTEAELGASNAEKASGCSSSLGESTTTPDAEEFKTISLNDMPDFTIPENLAGNEEHCRPVTFIDLREVYIPNNVTHLLTKEEEKENYAECYGHAM